MRAMLLVAVMAAMVPASNAMDTLALPTGPVVVVPLQMPDGTKLWRFATKAIKHEHAEESLRDLIAQGLANASWCSTGWEETRRTEPSKGVWMIEGRCK